MIHAVIEIGVAHVAIRLSRHLKEELAWAIDKWLQVIGNLKQLHHQETKEYIKPF